MPNQSTMVDQYLQALDHPMSGAIADLRLAILASDRAIAEHVKWNAPSFTFDGHDRVTFRIPPKGGLQLVFHRGRRVKDVAGFAFTDPTGLMAWASADRAVVTLRDPAEVATHAAAVVELVNRWMAETRE